MSAPCSTPIAWEDLVAYWAGDLEPLETDRIDEHLMGCGSCSASSVRVAAVTEGVRAMIPGFLSHAQLAALAERGLRITDNPVLASERKTAVFTLSTDLLLHRLGGMDLSTVESVQILVTNEDTGDLLLNDPHVPFDPSTGEILVACQRHFGEFNRTIVFEVHVREASGATQVSRFAIPHFFERASG